MKTLNVLAFVCALGCGGATESPTFDETDGGKSAPDSATETTATLDTGSTPTPESDTSTPTPATDTGKPAVEDTGKPATEAGTAGEAGKVNCGPTLKCAIPQVCCIGFAGGASYKCEASCSGLSAAAKCDGPEDCSGGQRCCSGFPSGAQCKATCGSSDQDMCHVDTDCSGGKTCKECTTPGGGPAMKFCVAGGKCPF